MDGLWEYRLVDLSIAQGKLMLHVRGADKLWAFKSSLEIPLVHIAGVRTDPEVARRLVSRDRDAGNQCAPESARGEVLSGWQE
jgi:hypothetical protein